MAGSSEGGELSLEDLDDFDDFEEEEEVESDDTTEDIEEIQYPTAKEWQSGSRVLKTRSWTKKIFFWLLRLSVHNAHRLQETKMTLSEFTVCLAQELIGAYAAGRQSVSRKRAASEQRKQYELGHFPEAMESHRNCVMHENRTRTKICCSVCKVPLCAVPCFAEYHTCKEDELLRSKKRFKK